MHGLYYRALQCFIEETYGHRTWTEICQVAETSVSVFEAMLTYDSASLDRLLSAATARLDCAQAELLEDLGLFLITHPTTQGLRRLLRFGGESFVEFLFSLEDLKNRAGMAMPDLDLPAFELRGHSSSAFSIFLTHSKGGFGHVLVGALRALADDYGSLAYISHGGSNVGFETVLVELIEVDFSEGREFSLVAA